MSLRCMLAVKQKVNEQNQRNHFKRDPIWSSSFEEQEKQNVYKSLLAGKVETTSGRKKKSSSKQRAEMRRKKGTGAN